MLRKIREYDKLIWLEFICALRIYDTMQKTHLNLWEFEFNLISMLINMQLGFPI